MSKFDIQVDDKEVKKALSKLQAQLKDMKPIFNDVTVIMFGDVQDHFSNEKGPDGKWAALAKTTLDQRRKKGRGAKILQDTGTLRNSFLKEAKKDAAILKNSVTKNNTNYGAKHNFGLNVTKREFMYLSPSAIKNITHLVLEKIKKTWDKT